MKIKKIILVLLIILLSGCSANYTVVLNENNTVSEKLVTKIADTDDNYSRLLDFIKNNKISKKNYRVIRDGEEIITTYNENYDNINSYVLNSKLYKQGFDDLDIQMKDNVNIISASGNFKKDTLSINKDNLIKLDYLQVNINSKLPVIYSNADNIIDDVHSWIYDGKQSKKEISFSYKRVPTLLTFKSVLIICTMVISIIAIGLIIYKRMNSIQQI